MEKGSKIGKSASRTRAVNIPAETPKKEEGKQRQKRGGTESCLTCAVHPASRPQGLKNPAFLRVKDGYLGKTNVPRGERVETLQTKTADVKALRVHTTV